MRIRSWSALKTNIFIIVAASIGLITCLSLIKPVGADPLPVIHESGTLTSDDIWSEGNIYVIDSTVTIASGVTLHISAGAIVKYVAPWNDQGIAVASGGHLDVAGSLSDPVVFTAYRDDTHGGDTNGDGTSTAYAADYPAAITLNGGDAAVRFADFMYANKAINGHTAGSLTIEDSSFTNSWSGIAVYSDNTSTVYGIERNHFAMTGNDFAVNLSGVQDVSNIVLAGTDENTFSGAGRQATVAISDAYVPTGTTWAVDASSGVILRVEQGQLTVNGTLSVGSGVVYAQCGPSYTSQPSTLVNGVMEIAHGAVVKSKLTQGIRVNTGATLEVVGTSSDKVTFTSLDDNAVGGDTDGNSSSIPSTDQYQSAIRLNGGGVGVVHANFKYATGIYGTTSTGLSVQDSAFTDAWTGANLTSDANAPLILRRDTFIMNGNDGPALLIYGSPDITTIPLSGTDQNIFAGTSGAIEMQVSGVVVPSSQTWEISQSSNAHVRVKDGGMVVDGTLTIDPDVVFEQDGPAYASEPSVTLNGSATLGHGVIIKSRFTNGIAVKAGGQLNINGAPNDPVIFTSLRDDTSGGRAGYSDGTPYGSDYGSAINMTHGSAAIGYANFKYAETAIKSGAPDNVVVADSTFSNMSHVMQIESPANFSFERNQMDVTDNVYAVRLFDVNDLTDMPLGGADANSFTGVLNGSRTVQVEGGAIPVLKTWTIASSSHAILSVTYDPVSVVGSLVLDPNVIFLQSGISWDQKPSAIVTGSMTLGSGVLVKQFYTKGIQVNPGGTLNVNGTATAPVNFTSINDDATGGDTPNDGSSTPARGEYDSAVAANGGTINITHAAIQYANKAIQSSSGTTNANYLTISKPSTGAQVGGGTVNLLHTQINDAYYGIYATGGSTVMRGSFGTITNFAVASCDWGAPSCFVDAAYTDWGTDAGPSPSTGGLACGQVVALPWLTSTGTAATGPIFWSANCSSSTSQNEQIVTRESNFGNMISSLGIDCSNGSQDACDAINRRVTCMQSAYSLAKTNATTSFSLPSNFTVGGFVQLLSDDFKDFIVDHGVADGTSDVLGAAQDATQITSDMNAAYNSCLSA